MKSGLMLLFSTLLAPSASAQLPSSTLPPSVRATGEAVISVKLDQAKIDIGVVTQAATAQTAASQNEHSHRPYWTGSAAHLGPEQTFGP